MSRFSKQSKTERIQFWVAKIKCMGTETGQKRGQVQYCSARRLQKEKNALETGVFGETRGIRGDVL